MCTNKSQPKRYYKSTINASWPPKHVNKFPNKKIKWNSPTSWYNEGKTPRGIAKPAAPQPLHAEKKGHFHIYAASAWTASVWESWMISNFCLSSSSCFFISCCLRNWAYFDRGLWIPHSVFFWPFHLPARSSSPSFTGLYKIISMLIKWVWIFSLSHLVLCQSPTLL